MGSDKNDIVRRVESITLSAAERGVIALRGLIAGLPWVGSSIETWCFGTLDEKRWKRTEAWVRALGDDLRNLEADCKRVPERFFESDAFSFFLEGTLRRVMSEVSQVKLDALRGILVSVVIGRPQLQFEKQSSFLKTVDAIEGTHIRVLQLLVSRRGGPESGHFLKYPEICNVLQVQGEADINFVYSALDTLANREFVQSGAIPFDDAGRLAKERQEFRATALGTEFIAFIRTSPDAAARSPT